VKIGIITVAFNEQDFIVPCIKQFDGFNFPHLVLVSNKPWRGMYEMDNTWVLAKMANSDPENVIVDYWPDQATQFNYGLELLEKDGFDWALIVDADEFYTAEDIGRLVGRIRTTEYDAIYASFMNVYWKSPEYQLFPDQEDYPIIAIKTNKRFKDKRHVESNVITTGTPTDLTLYHMSYVRTNEQMKKKIKTFEHSHEFDTDRWYEDTWTWWKPGHKFLHPVIPSQFEGTIEKPAPDEIRNLINWKT
jgi:glycosyltransferase involved in cell wall biosynthesis